MFNPNFECAEQEQANEATLKPEDQPHDVLSSSGSATHASEIEETVIASTKIHLLTQSAVVADGKKKR